MTLALYVEAGIRASYAFSPSLSLFLSEWLRERREGTCVGEQVYCLCEPLEQRYDAAERTERASSMQTTNFRRVPQFFFWGDVLMESGLSLMYSFNEVTYALKSVSS